MQTLLLPQHPQSNTTRGSADSVGSNMRMRTPRRIRLNGAVVGKAAVKRWMASAILVSSAAVLAACGTTATTSSNVTTTKPPTTSTSNSVSATTCLSDQLTVVSMGALRGAGSADQQLGFVNVSTSTCTMKGWPKVALLNAAGTQAAQATSSPIAPGNTSASSVTLAPGGTAEAVVSGGNGSAGSAVCSTYPWFAVTPPGLTRSTPPGTSLSTKVAVGLPFSTTGFSVCGTVWVSPVRPAGTALTG